MIDFPNELKIWMPEPYKYRGDARDHINGEKYHHDRVVKNLQQRNARLVEALDFAWLRMNTDKPTDLEYIHLILKEAKQALAENKE